MTPNLPPDPHLPPSELAEPQVPDPNGPPVLSSRVQSTAKAVVSVGGAVVIGGVVGFVVLATLATPTRGAMRSQQVQWQQRRQQAAAACAALDDAAARPAPAPEQPHD
jgi:hypothetical protein